MKKHYAYIGIGLAAVFAVIIGSHGSIPAESNPEFPVAPLAQQEISVVQNTEKLSTQTNEQIQVAESASSARSSLSNDSYYTNIDGNQIHSPAYSDSVPAGASARCRDGTYSFSQNRRGTCSHHGGVASWL